MTRGAVWSMSHLAQWRSRPRKSRKSNSITRTAGVTKYVFCQDAKVIAIQYSLHGHGDRPGGAGAVLADAAAARLSRHASPSSTPNDYYQFITMHGMIMVIYLLTALFLGGFGNYLIPLMVGARDMVFPYVNMLSYWVYLLAVLVLVASFFAPGGPDRRRLDAVSAAGHPVRHAGATTGASS